MYRYFPFIIWAILVFALLPCAQAQTKIQSVHLAYFTPFFTSNGISLGSALNLNSTDKTNANMGSKHQWNVLLQLSYYNQRSVANNLLFNSEIIHRWQRPKSLFFIATSAGIGMLTSFQKQEAIMDLATGELHYANEIIHYFLPNINLSLGLRSKSKFDYYLKPTLGKKLNSANANQLFFGLSIGAIFNFKS